MTDFTFKNINDGLKAQQREYRLQVCAVEQIPVWYPGLRFFHVPNRPGSGTDGFHKKRMGAKAGVSDLIFTWRADGKLCCGLIELKSDEGKLRNDQNRFLSSYDAIGWHTGVAKSCRETHALLCSWGLKPASNGIREPDYRTDADKKQDDFAWFAPKDAPIDADPGEPGAPVMRGLEF